MKDMMAYLKLMRYPNLLIIVLTQYFYKYFIIEPLYRSEGIANSPGGHYFIFLVLSTVCIAAAGYAINDYFDMRVDRINKPDRMLLGRIIPRRMAILIHIIGTTLGILFGFVAAFMVGEWKLGLISAVIAFTLWQYSHKFKASFITGNFVIAVFSAFVVFIVWLYEFYAQTHTGEALLKGKFFFDMFMLTYIFFAFATSFIREIVKDTEDIEGDRRVGCRTIPIELGVPRAKIIIFVFTGIVMLFLSFIAFKVYSYPALKLVVYYLGVLLALFAYLFIQVVRAQEKSDYSFISMYLKIIMLAGVFTMQLIYILIK